MTISFQGAANASFIIFHKFVKSSTLAVRGRTKLHSCLFRLNGMDVESNQALQK